MNRICLIIAGILSAVAGATPALAAPKQLHNKSVIIAWADSVYQKYPDGSAGTATIGRQRIAYVSSAGRVFVRSINTDRNATLNRELAPGEQQGSLAFQGNNMVGHAVFSGFARRVLVTFDSSYSNCTATVTYGRSGGPTTWKSFDQKRTFQVESITAGSPSCSIREGNAAAS